MLNSLKKLFALLSRREKRSFFLVLFVMVVLVFLEMARVGSVLPLITAVADPAVIQRNTVYQEVHRALGEPTYETFFILMAVALIVVTILRNAWNALTDYAIVRYSKMRAFTFSRRLLGRYLNQPYSYFLNHNTTTLRRNVLGEVNQATSFLTNMLKFFSQGLKVLGLIALIVVADPLLALIAASTLIVMYGATYVLIRGRLARYGRRRLKSNRDRFKTTAEALDGIKTVRAHDSEHFFLDRFATAARKNAKFQIIIEVLSTVPKYVLDSIVYGGIIGVVIFFVIYVGSIEQHLATLGLFVVAASRLMPGLKQTLTNYSKMRSEYPAVQTIYEDMTRKTPLKPKRSANVTAATPDDRVTLSEELALEHIVFQYEGAERPLFAGLDLRIKANTTVGLVGKTGCGKTTLLDILLGLLSPQSGRLIVDDVTVTDKNMAAWRRNLGYVPQDIYLIDDTIARNIAFGIPDEEIDHDSVRRAADVAQIGDFIENELPAGYEAEIGERGVRLSGGQRQRLGIARALYHDPEVLLFDEATSALDSRTERELMRFIDSLSRQKTIVMIAHRLSTVQRCDNIYVMSEGRIMDQGSYDELLSRSGDFQALAQAPQ
jgi:ABC-type multidrug transport system fused ATPase/permease subunit